MKNKFFVAFLILAPQTLIASPEKFSMNFKDIEIRDLVRLISEWTGKNFLLDQRVRGKVTIISPKKVTHKEALRIFESILNANDLTMAEVGKVVRIVPASQARQSNIPTYIEPVTLLPSEQFVTRVIPLKYISAAQISNVLRNLISRNGFLQVYEPTNTLILIDTIANSNRLLDIIDVLDVPIFEQRIEFMPLKYASVQDVSSILNQVFGRGVSPRRMGRGAQPAQIKIIPETRTNSLIISATEQDIKEIKELVAKLDVPTAVGEVNVIYLKYAKAEEVAGILGQLAGAPARGRRAGAQPTVIEAGIRIAADKSTNSLIVVASKADFEKIKSIVGKLDIPRKQVFVETIIMEVSLSKLAELGLAVLAGSRTNDVGILGGAALDTLSALFLDPQAIQNLSGVFFGATGETVEIETPAGQVLTLPSLAAILRALASDTDVNILSTPHILTTDNKEAEIRVAENIPFPVGQAVGAGGVTTLTIQRQDVGIILKITPQIIEDNAVQLDISTEVSNVAEAPRGLDVARFGISTLKRSASTSILVNDKQTVVIGGLMRTRESLVKTKVPILGDIPVIGWLFRSTMKRSDKANLLIFLTPHVIKTPEELENIKTKKVEEYKEFREREKGM